MGASPRVSVIMAVYNGERHLRAAMDSVLGQTLGDLEFLVVDDGSTDATSEILASYGDARVRVIRHDHEGQTRALNRGVELAQAPYLTRQDADDISRPDRLEKQIAFLDHHEEVGVLGTGVTLIDEDGHRLRDYLYPTDHQLLSARLNRCENPLPHTTLTLRTTVMRKLGGYEPQFRKAQDFDLLLRAIERDRVASLAEPLCELRHSLNSATFEGDNAEQLRWTLLAYLRARVRREEGEDLLRIPDWPQLLTDYERWFSSSRYPRVFRASRERRRARIAFGSKEYLKGIRALAEALLYDPFWLPSKVGLTSPDTLVRDGLEWLHKSRPGGRPHVRNCGHPNA